MTDKADDKNQLHSQFVPRNAMKGFEVKPYEEVSECLGKLSIKTTDFVKKLDEEKLKKDKHES